MKKRVKKIIATVLTSAMAMSVGMPAFAANISSTNVQTEEMMVNDVLLEITKYNDGTNDVTLVDIAEPASDEMNYQEKKAIEDYGKMQNTAFQQNMIVPQSTDSKPLSLHSEANNGRYELNVSGQWYRDTSKSLLQIKSGRFMEGYNKSGYSNRVIRFREIATFSSVGATGLSISASGFSISGGAFNKSAEWTSPTYTDVAYSSINRYADISSTSGVISYSHSGVYRAELSTGYAGNYIDFGTEDSWLER